MEEVTRTIKRKCDICKKEVGPLLNGNDRKKYFETNVCPKCRAWQYVEFMQGG